MPLTEYDFTHENAADRLFYGHPGVKKASAMCFYHENGMVQQLIHTLKYRKVEKIGVFLGSWYGALLRREAALQKVDCVFPVPLHRKKERKRGYNQCSGFGREIARALGVAFTELQLVRRQDSPTQTSKNRWQRWKGTTGTFSVPHPECLEGKNILLVDDVITTGATLGACCEALEQARPRGVYIAAMAIVP